jgi:hypothetical protein
MVLQIKVLPSSHSASQTFIFIFILFFKIYFVASRLSLFNSSYVFFFLFSLIPVVHSFYVTLKGKLQNSSLSMKGSRGIAPLILSLGARWERATSRPVPLYPWELTLVPCHPTVPGSIPRGVAGFFSDIFPSDHTMALGSTQPLVKMSTRNIPGSKGGRCVRLTSPPSRAECHEICEPESSGTLWAKPGLLRDCFTFTLPPWCPRADLDILLPPGF